MTTLLHESLQGSPKTGKRPCASFSGTHKTPPDALTSLDPKAADVPDITWVRALRSPFDALRKQNRTSAGYLPRVIVRFGDLRQFSAVSWLQWRCHENPHSNSPVLIGSRSQLSDRRRGQSANKSDTNVTETQECCSRSLALVRLAVQKTSSTRPQRS